MHKKLLLYKLDRLLHLLVTTEPKEEKLPDNELFTSDLIKVVYGSSDIRLKS